MLKLNSKKPASKLKDTKCIICMSKDARCIGKFYWCSMCDFRARLLAWGQGHGYPDLKLGYYAIGPGEECWVVACLLGCEEMIRIAIEYVAMLEGDDTAGLSDGNEE
jgi:hypothetical protein